MDERWSLVVVLGSSSSEKLQYERDPEPVNIRDRKMEMWRCCVAKAVSYSFSHTTCESLCPATGRFLPPAAV
jgi:hypothetical protein